ncbi:hypothetical protein ACFXO9_15025 [Nocardia tengchongensis]|uniref:hypothetical protein n=1 Tax=Nocardia tengchongensis TaxID=2055889 RepID=UPI00369490E3
MPDAEDPWVPQQIVCERRAASGGSGPTCQWQMGISPADLVATTSAPTFAEVRHQLGIRPDPARGFGTVRCG